MTPIAWIAILGPIIAMACGIGIGFFMGVAHNAEEVGSMREQIGQLTRQLAMYRERLLAQAAAPPTRRESARVLDLVTPSANG